MAVEDINAKGGINGSPLAIDIGDAQVDPGQAVLLFRKYVNDGYLGVIGPMT
jgi:branched-chain amino acid transport system substrate-binding protein